MIQLEQARDLLRRAVETQGRDFVYNPGGEYACLYQAAPPDEARFDGDPRTRTGCLIGVALDLAGIDVHHGQVASIVDVSIENPGVISEAATRYFRTAQQNQDTGRTWGEAWDRAEKHLDTYRQYPDDASPTDDLIGE